MILEITAISVGSSIAALWFGYRLTQMLRFKDQPKYHDEWELLEWRRDMEETLNCPGPCLLQVCRKPAE